MGYTTAETHRVHNIARSLIREKYRDRFFELKRHYREQLQECDREHLRFGATIYNRAVAQLVREKRVEYTSLVKSLRQEKDLT